MSESIKLITPPIHQDSALLRGPFGRPEIQRVGDNGVLCITYSVNRIHSVRGSKDEEQDLNEDAATRSESADGSGEAYMPLPLDYFYSRRDRKMQIADVDFPSLVGASRNFAVEDYAKVIRVLDFGRCSTKTAGDLITAMTPPGSPVLDIAGLETRNGVSVSLVEKYHPNTTGMEKYYGFVTGISLRATYEANSSLSLFISIPYLGLGKDTTRAAEKQIVNWNDSTPIGDISNRMEGSRTLREYRLQHIAGEIDCSVNTALVHQRWFLVFDNVIALFRSENDDSSNLAPLYPYQQRMGVFQALVNMISNTITFSEEAALKKFGKNVAEMESRIHLRMDNCEARIRAVNIGEEQVSGVNISEDQGSALKKERAEIEHLRHEMEDLIKGFESYVLDVSTMMNVVRSQIQYLAQLEKIFQNPYGATVGQPQPHKNSFKIPHIHGQREQIIVVIATLKRMVEERESCFKELSIWERDMKLGRDLFVERFQRLATIAQGSVGVAHVVATQEMQTAISNQGQTISLFTFITTVFLPLGFFCGYFAINPVGYQSTIKTQGDFWMRAGPVTGVLAGLMSIFLVKPDNKLKDWFKKIVDYLSGGAR